MWKLRVTTAGVLALLLIGGQAEVAQATVYSTLGCKFNGTDPSVWYKRSALLANNNFWNATTNGAGRWNAVSAPGTFYPTSAGSVNVTVSEASLADPLAWAMTQGICVNPGWPADNWSNNQVSLVWSTSGASTLTATQLRMVATHELGHALGLGHIPASCSGTKAVMVQGEAKWSCGWGVEPWQNDIDNVNWVY